MSDAELPEKTRAEQSDGSAQRLRQADVQNDHGPLARASKIHFSSFCLLGKKGIKLTSPPISCHVSRVIIPKKDGTPDGSSGAGMGVGLELCDSPGPLRSRSQICTAAPGSAELRRPAGAPAAAELLQSTASACSYRANNETVPEICEIKVDLWGHIGGFKCFFQSVGTDLTAEC